MWVQVVVLQPLLDSQAGAGPRRASSWLSGSSAAAMKARTPGEDHRSDQMGQQVVVLGALEEIVEGGVGDGLAADAFVGQGIPVEGRQRRNAEGYHAPERRRMRP